MSLHIDYSEDVAVIAPILTVLRSTLAKDVFDARLSRALQNGFRVLIAQDTDSTQGCLGYRICHDVFWGKTLYVDDLVVRPETRGTGVGAALLDVAKQEARAQDCDHVRLCSGLSRLDAHRFYEQNDFKKTSMQFFHVVQKGDT